MSSIQFFTVYSLLFSVFLVNKCSVDLFQIVLACPAPDSLFVIKWPPLSLNVATHVYHFEGGLLTSP